MLIIIISPILFTISSMKLDKYFAENYYLYKEDDGKLYVKFDYYNKEEIESLRDEVTNKDDYYHKTVKFFGNENINYDYNYSKIRADRLEYSVVRLARLLDIVVTISILFSIVLWFICAFKLIEQIINFNKNYSRTVEGNKLLNKAYALKNYLKDFSLMKDRNQNELILWEYYMIYAVILDVNTKIENEIVENYLKDISIVL